MKERTNLNLRPGATDFINVGIKETEQEVGIVPQTYMDESDRMPQIERKHSAGCSGAYL